MLHYGFKWSDAVNRLSDASDNALLKMADFGLSAVMFAAEESADQMSGEKSQESESGNRAGALKDVSVSEGSPVKRLRSVVGSPHYVAPEITGGASFYILVISVHDMICLL